jgi:threonyl-tRNA synthetase
MINIKLPDGSVKNYEASVSGQKIAKDLAPSLAKKAIAIKVDDCVMDLSQEIKKDAEIKILTASDDDEEALDVLRHSMAHLMAEALQEIYGKEKIKFAIGPVIENGFYYDFDMDEAISVDDFPKIESKMKEIIDRDENIERAVWERNEAIKHFEKSSDIYKVQNAEAVPEGEEISIYKQGEFLDLCRGPHVPSTKKLSKHFKLLKVAGAYWKGDSNNKMLQRIYGTAWFSKERLESHLNYLEEVKLRDHRKLNNDLDLYTLEPNVGAGLPLWTENGTILREEIEYLSRSKERECGIKRVFTPHIIKESSYHLSGHLPYYEDSMYNPMDIDGENYYLKPMNCPHHHYIYKRKGRSYRDLPIRYVEFGHVYRYESSGALNGLFRVRAFTINDVHIYCSKSQAKTEFLMLLKLIQEYLEIFEIKDYWISLSLPDMNKLDKFVNEPEKWKEAAKIIKDALDESKIEYFEEEGEAAFYGPKFDLQIKSAIGTEYTTCTNQLDFYVPKKFGLSFTNEEGEDEQVYIVHSAPLSAHERFIGFLTEHYAGKFPTWLAPKQVMIIPISEKHNDYADKVYNEIFNEEVRNATQGIRVEKDFRSESMQKKIRDAQLQKIPYIVIVGDKEKDAEKISLRLRSGKEINGIDNDDFIDLLKKEIYERKDLSDEDKEKELND